MFRDLILPVLTGGFPNSTFPRRCTEPAPLPHDLPTAQQGTEVRLQGFHFWDVRSVWDRVCVARLKKWGGKNMGFPVLPLLSLWQVQLCCGVRDDGCFTKRLDQGQAIMWAGGPVKEFGQAVGGEGVPDLAWHMGVGRQSILPRPVHCHTRPCWCWTEQVGSPWTLAWDPQGQGTLTRGDGMGWAGGQRVASGSGMGRWGCWEVESSCHTSPTLPLTQGWGNWLQMPQPGLPRVFGPGRAKGSAVGQIESLGRPDLAREPYFARPWVRSGIYLG